MKQTSRSFVYLCLYLMLSAISNPILAQKKQLHQLTLSYPKTPDWSLSESFMQELIDLFKANIFIESGTYLGTTAERAARHFKEVHTMELSSSLFQQAEQRLHGHSNVHVYCGDSTQLLPSILKNVTGKIVFWLDGHYSEGGTAKGSKNTPAMEELLAIQQSGITDAVILIDDMRCFQEVDDRPENQSLKGYPSVAELETAILAINKDYHFYIFGDTALAYPASDNVIVSPVIQACTISRLSDKKLISHQELAQAENTIAQASGEEQQTIKTLCDLFAQSAQRHGIAGHYYFWYSLMLAHLGDINTAHIYENRARVLGVSHHN